MQFKKSVIIILIALIGAPAWTQDVSRWIRFADKGRPEFIRHPLNEAAKGGATLHFRYETKPVSPLLRIIRKNFPETKAKQTFSEDIMDGGKSTILVEKMQYEADEYLLIATATAETASAPQSLF